MSAPPAAPPLQRTPARPLRLPLTFAQERLWFLDRLRPGSAAYNLPALHLRLAGELDAAALARAWAALVERHEALRARFGEEEGRPFQEVVEAGPALLSTVDLSVLPGTTAEREMELWVGRETRRPFDLARHPLWRATLYRLTPRLHRLAIGVHHIVADGWSVALLTSEIGVLYSAFLAGAPSPLPPLPLGYGDYALWQRQWLAGDALAALLEPQRQSLGSHAPLLELPADHPRPAVPGGRGRRLGFELGMGLSAAVREAGRRERATPFMLLLAAFGLLLARYTGQEQILVGFPVAGRPRTALEGLVGLFANTLVVRIDLAEGQGFRRLARQVRGAVLGALAHQELPFERLVEALAPERTPSHAPLVQVLFSLEHDPPGILEMPGLELAPEGASSAAAKLDLTLTLYDHDAEGFSGVLELDRDLFEEVTGRRLIEHQKALLRAGLAAPGVRLSRLPMLPAGERHQLLVEWNDTRREGAGEGTVAGAFAEKTAAAPDAVALVWGEGALSYGALAEEARELATELARMGVGLETPVGIALERGPAAIVAILAVLMAGGVYVPLEEGGRAGVPFLITVEKDKDLKDSKDKKSFRSRSGVFVLYVLYVLYVLSSASPTPDNLAYILHTSGSTGEPKGVAIPHRGILRLVRGGFAALGPNETFLQLAPLSFDASTFEIWGCLLHGGRLVLAPPGPPALDEISTLVERFGVTTLWLTAGLFYLVADGPLTGLSGLRQLLAGGDVLSPPHVRRFRAALPGVRLVDGYGPTECTTFACCGTVGPAEEVTDPISIGRPIGNTRAHVLDATLLPAPVGVPGELWLGGDGLARGYHRAPALTAESFAPDPFATTSTSGARLYRTGDRARRLRDGRLELLGRTDGQVKIRGFRVETGAVEAALAAHPDVLEAAVVPSGGAAHERRLFAFVVPRGEAAVDGSGLRAWLAGRLPAPLIPAAFLALGSLPLTPHGKVDRRALVLQSESAFHGLAASPGEEPQTPLERRLAALWSELLGRGVGRHDGFFALGGDSLLAIQLVARAGREGIPLTLRQLFEHQSVAALAADLGSGAAASTAEPGWGEGPVPATPGTAWFFDRVAADLAAPHHFSNSSLLEVRAALPPAAAARAIARLAFQHDALRLEVRPGAGSWETHCGGAEAAANLFSCIDLARLPEAARRPAVEAAAKALFDRPDLTGPLARFVLFPRGTGRHPLLLALLHHLVADGASFRILQEDLATVLSQASRGEEPTLPPRTTSFKAWAETQHRLAHSPEVQRHAEEWLALARAGGQPLPVDFAGERHTGEVGRIAVAAGPEETRALLGAGSRFHALVVTALVRAFTTWMGTHRVLLRQTNHGRNPAVAGVDLSRTVGWISQTYPVLFTLPEAGDSENTETTLAAIEEQLAAVPLGGLSYGLLRYMSGDPEIEARLREAVASPAATFNFLGRSTAAPPAEPPLLARLPWPLGPGKTLKRHDPQLRVTAAVAGDPERLELAFEYGKDFYRPATIERLAAGALSTLGRSARAPGRLLGTRIPK